MKPALPRILGSGPLADAMRAQVAADPDRYRPETWSVNPAGVCPCCESEVFRCTTRHTGFVEGFASHANVVHPRMDLHTGRLATEETKAVVPGCCCVAPNWGPEHVDEPAAIRDQARSWVEVRAAHLAHPDTDVGDFSQREWAGYNEEDEYVQAGERHRFLEEGDDFEYEAGFLARQIHDCEEP